MKKIALLGMLIATIVACICLAGCDEKYKVPTKPGGGGKSQPYLPRDNKHGGQYIHLDKN